MYTFIRKETVAIALLTLFLVGCSTVPQQRAPSSASPVEEDKAGEEASSSDGAEEEPGFYLPDPTEEGYAVASVLISGERYYIEAKLPERWTFVKFPYDNSSYSFYEADKVKGMLSGGSLIENEDDPIPDKLFPGEDARCDYWCKTVGDKQIKFASFATPKESYSCKYVIAVDGIYFNMDFVLPHLYDEEEMEKHRQIWETVRIVEAQ